MSEVKTGTICGLQVHHYANNIEVVFEQYQDDGINYDDNKILQSFSLGEFNKSEIDKFYKPLSLKADGYAGEVTITFVDELKDIIQQNLNP